MTSSKRLLKLKVPKLLGHFTELSGPDYLVKVPADVRLANEEKLAGSEAEVKRLTEAVTALNSIEA